MNAVAKSEPQGQLVTANGATLMEVISRAAQDPNTDVDKLERLMGMYERITERQAEQLYSEAMNAAQEAMRPVAADASNPQTHSKYASYHALDKALRPTYTRNGFSISFDTADGAPPEHVRVVAKVAHRDGHKEYPHLDMPVDGKGAKGGDVMTKTHAIGAAVTYGKRYLLGMIFNIAVGEDTDGNSNGGREMSAGGQAAMTSLNACPGEVEPLREWKGKNAAGLDLLPTAEADEIVRTFNTRIRKAKEKAAAQ